MDSSFEQGRPEVEEMQIKIQGCSTAAAQYDGLSGHDRRCKTVIKASNRLSTTWFPPICMYNTVEHPAQHSTTRCLVPTREVAYPSHCPSLTYLPDLSSTVKNRRIGCCGCARWGRSVALCVRSHCCRHCCRCPGVLQAAGRQTQAPFPLLAPQRGSLAADLRRHTPAR